MRPNISLGLSFALVLTLSQTGLAERRNAVRMGLKPQAAPQRAQMKVKKEESAPVAAAASAHPEAASRGGVSIGGGSITFPSITIGNVGRPLDVPDIGGRTFGPSGQAYTVAGGIQLGDWDSDRIFFQNGSPRIYGYMLSMDRACVIRNSGVNAVNPDEITQKTALISKKLDPDFPRTIHYEYEVNGLMGADLKALVINMGQRDKGGPLRNLFVTDICPITISIRTTPR